MKIGFLTSSRADFGILYPLIAKMERDSSFEVEIIAFGTHLSKDHGHTIDEILNYGLSVPHSIETNVYNDTPVDISKTIADTMFKFATFWEKNSFDLVFALGDRYEMYAAVSAAFPLGVKIAHIHAGETTLGAIDNAYRHAISLMSAVQFVTTDKYLTRVCNILGEQNNAYNVGALSIDNLYNQKLLSKSEFNNRFGITFNRPTILSTFHPETVGYERNEIYIKELLSAFSELENEYQIVITMPNTDTMGNMIREKIISYSKNNLNVKVIESFGMQGYLTCMKYCSMMVGNTSSGFVEAAFFLTKVLNIGNRQDGRILTDNILTVAVQKNKILEGVKVLEDMDVSNYTSVYGSGDSAKQIIAQIKINYGLK